MANEIDLYSFPTYRALEDYKEQQFTSLIWVYEHLLESPEAQKMIQIFGEEGVYDQLVYHQKLIIAVSEFKSAALLQDYLQWRYRVVTSRGISSEYFLIEHAYWIKALQLYLFEAFSSEFTSLYQTIQSLHETYLYASVSPLSLYETQSIIEALVQSLITNDEVRVNHLFQSNLYRFESPLNFFDTVIKPTMIEIGRLWEINTISMAKEHIATAMIERLWNHYADQSSSTHLSNQVAFVVLPEQQLHKLGAKMVTTMLNRNGWKVANLSLNENFHDIFDAILEFHPQLIILSASMAIHIPLIQRFINELKADSHFYSGKIALGGQAFYRTHPPILIEKTDFQGENLQDLEHYVLTLKDQLPLL